MSWLRKTTFATLIVAVALLGSTVSGQSVSPLTEQSGASQNIPGKPTLKVRVARETPISPSVSSQHQPTNEEHGNQDSSSKLAKEPNVRFEGLHAFTVEAVLQLFREKEVWLAMNQKSAYEVSAKATTVLKEALESRGYMRASIEARLNDEGNSLALMVFEGPRSSIKQIRFEGNRIFSSQELTGRVKKFLSAYEECRNGYNADILDVCLRLLVNDMRGQGYLQARAGEPKKELDGNELIITVPFAEGALYRLGEIKIEGAERFTQEEVRAMLSLQRKDIINGEAIAKWLFEDLKNLYGEIGFIEYTAEPEPTFSAVDPATNEGTVDFKVFIEEGKQFTIGSITFKGGDASDKDLGNLLLIHAGDIFNQQLLEKSVQQLNDTKWFETIDKDKDTEFRLDDEAPLLNITFRLKHLQASK